MNLPKLVLAAIAACAIPGVAAAGDLVGSRGYAMNDLFVDLDTNQNGKVTRDELLQHSALRFQETDINDDGALDPEEFIAAMLRPYRDQIRRRFMLFDTDGNGVISEAELAQVIVRQYSRLDGDWDGGITLNELRAAARPPGPGN